MEALNILRADIEPKATDSIDAIKDFISKLLERGYAYKISNGDIYFDTSKDLKYGAISNMVVMMM